MDDARKPYQFAQELLGQHGITRPPVDVEKLAELVGAMVVRTRSRGGESGFTLRDGQRVVIGVNNGTSPKRQRFTIAHEIGHVLMHEGRPLIVDKSIRTHYRMNFRDERSSMATDVEEREANAFAASLLMPKDMLYESTRQYYNESVSREELIATLAREYDVSTEAMGFRLINLGIMSA